MGDNTTTPHEAATPSSVVTKFSSGPTNRLKHVQERRQDVQGGGAAPRGIQQERLHQVQRSLLRQRFYRVLHPRLALLENSLDRHFLVLVHLRGGNLGGHLAPRLRLQKHQTHPQGQNRRQERGCCH